MRIASSILTAFTCSSASSLASCSSSVGGILVSYCSLDALSRIKNRTISLVSVSSLPSTFLSKFLSVFSHDDPIPNTVRVSFGGSVVLSEHRTLHIQVLPFPSFAILYIPCLLSSSGKSKLMVLQPLLLVVVLNKKATSSVVSCKLLSL